MRSVGESLLAQPFSVDAEAVYEAARLGVEVHLDTCGAACLPIVEGWKTADLPETAACVDALTDIASWVATAKEGLVAFEAPLRVVLLGRTQAGKSSLFCLLTGASQERIGEGAQATTQDVTRLPLITVPGIEVSDTPGVGALDRLVDRLVALEEARRADLVIWVCTDDSFQSEEQDALEEVLSWGTPVVLALHCFDDLSTAKKIQRFLKRPELQPRQLCASAPSGGHLARPLRMFQRRGQRPAAVIPLHAEAALAAESNPSWAAELIDASNLGQLITLLHSEVQYARDLRRTSAAVDSCRQTLDESRRLAMRCSEETNARHVLAAKAQEDLERRSARLIDSALAAVTDTVHKRFAVFSGWADEHYRNENTKEVVALLNADLSAAMVDIDKDLSRRATKLHKSLVELGTSVAEEWEAVDASMMSSGKAWHRGLPSRWRKGVAGGVVVGAATIAGFLVGGPLGLAAGAGVQAVGSWIVGKIPWLGRARKEALSQRRAALQMEVNSQCDEAIALLVKHWTSRVDQVLRRQLKTHLARARLNNEDRRQLAIQLSELATACRDSAVALDSILVRGLLELEGHADLCDHVSEVHRVPGGACAIMLDHPPHLAAMRLHPLLRDAAYLPARGESALASLTRLLGRRSTHGWHAGIDGTTTSGALMLLVVPPSEQAVAEARRVAEFASQVLDRPVGIASPRDTLHDAELTGVPT